MTLCPNSVLITGANRGIGLEFVKQFLKLKSPPQYVFAACRSPDNAKDLQDIAKSSSALKIIKIDLLDLETVAESVKVVQETLGDKGLSMIINNAGVLKRDDISSVTPAALSEQFNVNVTGPIMVVQSYLPLLRKAANAAPGFSINNAAVFNITSGLGSIGDNSSGSMYAYRASKAAQNMVTRTMAMDFKKDRILVATILPGWVQTDMGGKSAKLTTEESVSSMMKVMASCQAEKDTGKFYHYNGSEMPW